MPIYKGNVEIDKVYKGADELDNVRLGAQQQWIGQILTTNPTITSITGNSNTTNGTVSFSIKNNHINPVTIYYEVNNANPNAYNATLVAGATGNYSLTNLNASTSYTLYVYALETGQIPSSVVNVGFTTLQLLVATPTITYSSDTTSSLTFTLRNNDALTASIRYDLNNTNPTGNAFNLNSGSTSSKTISGLLDGTSYTIHTRAIVSGKRDSSVASITRTTARFTTANPSISVLSTTTNSITYRVTYNDDRSGYLRHAVNNSNPNIYTYNRTQGSIVDYTRTGLSAGTGFTIYARAYADRKNSSSLVSLSASTQAFTATPTISSISASGSSVTFNLKNNDGSSATLYYEVNDSTPDANSQSFSAGETKSVTLSGLSPNTGYTIYANAQASGKGLSSTTSAGFSTPDTRFDVTAITVSNKNFGIPQYSAGIHFSTDGQHFFIDNWKDFTIRRYTMSTNWDIATASFTQSVGSTGGKGVNFSPDGTKMYSARENSWVKQWNLSTPYDLTSITSNKLHYHFSYSTYYGVAIEPTQGKNIFLRTNGTLRYWPLNGTNFDLGDNNYLDSQGTVLYTYSTSGGISITPDGLNYFLIANTFGSTFVRIKLTSPMDFSNAVVTSGGSALKIDGLYVRPDGTQLWTFNGYRSSLIQEYNFG
jgi:hypothetical protein